MSWGQEPEEPGRGRDPGPSEDPDVGWDDGREPRWVDPGGWGDDGAASQPPPGAPPPRDPERRRNPQLGRDPQWGRDPARDGLRPLDLGDVLDGMFRITRRHWQAFAIALSVVVVPLALLSSIALFEANAGGSSSLFNAFQDSVAPTAAPPDAASVARVLASTLLSGLGTLLLTPLIYGISVQVAARGYREGDVEPMPAVRAAASRYPSLLGVLFFATVAILGLLTVLPIVFGALLSNSGLEGPAGIFGVGLVILVGFVAAVIVAIRLSLTIPAVMVEGAGTFDALRRSNELVRGGTPRMFGILLVVGIVVSIISFVVSLPFELVLLSGSTVGVVVATAGSIVSSLLTYSLMAVAIVLLYFDRRVRTEGYDLSELARELGEETRPQW